MAMPSKVRAHKATRGRTTYQVRSYIRNGPEHSKEWRHLVASIRASKGWRGGSPEAVATSLLGPRSWSSAERRKLRQEGRL